LLGKLGRICSTSCSRSRRRATGCSSCRLTSLTSGSRSSRSGSGSTPTSWIGNETNVACRNSFFHLCSGPQTSNPSWRAVLASCETKDRDRRLFKPVVRVKYLLGSLFYCRLKALCMQWRVCILAVGCAGLHCLESESLAECSWHAIVQSK
jgi:hypothetical protein